MKEILAEIVIAEKVRRIPMSGSRQKYGHSDAPRAVVSFPVDSAGMQYENMHAKHVSGDVYELDNSPFYVFDISAGDVFSVNEVDGRILFNKIESRGGHSTYRVKMPFGAGHDKFEALWGELSEIGCSYEGSGKGDRLLYSIDVPPGVSVDKVYEILGKNEELNLWEFEEGHYFKSMQH